MNRPSFSLDTASVSIIGLGLMGGSLALALKEHCRHLSAVEPDLPTIELARRKGIVDAIDSEPANILSDADIIILACPVPAILEWLERLPDYVQQPCIVMDIGSSKRTIAAALEQLPSNFEPIGGHAICGREQLSLENADQFLFHGAPFVLTPLQRTSDSARQIALEIINVLSASPLWLDAQDHDQMLAYTSHLPYLLSSALALATPQDAADCVGPGFRSSVRLAGTPSSMMLGVLLTNRDTVLAAIQSFRDQLHSLEIALRDNDGGSLKSFLDKAHDNVQSLIS